MPLCGSPPGSVQSPPGTGEPPRMVYMSTGCSLSHTVSDPGSMGAAICTQITTFKVEVSTGAPSSVPVKTALWNPTSAGVGVKPTTMVAFKPAVESITVKLLIVGQLAAGTVVCPGSGDKKPVVISVYSPTQTTSVSQIDCAVTTGGTLAKVMSVE